MSGDGEITGPVEEPGEGNGGENGHDGQDAGDEAQRTGLPAKKERRPPIWREETTRLLWAPFAEDEVRHKYESLSNVTLQIDQHEEEKKNLTGSLTARIKALKTEQKALARELHAGGEKRNVDCEVIRDLGRGLYVIMRKDTGEVIESRPLTAEERQGRMF